MWEFADKINVIVLMLSESSIAQSHVILCFPGLNQCGKANFILHKEYALKSNAKQFLAITKALH